MRICLDLDEVLADWIGGVCNYLGITEAEGDRQFGLPLWSGPLLWGALETKADFWAGLQPLPWMKELVDLCFDTVGLCNVYVCTTPGPCGSSMLGKKLWMQKHLEILGDRYVFTPHKHLLAKRGTMLIDDSETNCKRFVTEGGDAVLFAHRRNSLREHASNPVPYLRKQLEALATFKMWRGLL